MATLRQVNETNQVETEAGEEQPGAISGTSETWSKTSTHAADTTRPGSLNAELTSRGIVGTFHPQG